MLFISQALRNVILLFFIFKNLQISKIIPNFAIDSVSPQGREGHNLLVKDVYERYLRGSESRKFELSSKERNRNVCVGLLYPVHLIIDRVDERI